jgi:Mg2+ and Co2+ transporter CorA
LKECRIMLYFLYKYQMKNYKDDSNKDNQKIDFYIKYMNFVHDRLKGFESHLLTLIATIFLPLSFLVGFFGMNFKSM